MPPLIVSVDPHTVSAMSIDHTGAGSVAIIGGGPAGSTLAALLAGAGVRVALFHLGKRPELIVGESLVPAIVPILARLGVEADVRDIGVRKPGATVGFGDGDVYPLPFAEADGALPDYSYNVPRDRFDALLLASAAKRGARVFDTSVRVVRAAKGRLALTPEACALARDVFGAGGPDVVVDASGRARVGARALGLPCVGGSREDVALFAHFDRVGLTRPGDIHVDRIARGWAWRIPLPGRVSVGVVVAPRHLPAAPTRTAAFDAFVASDPFLHRVTQGGSRLTNVVSYDNYQRRASRLVGPGWALVGDAAGFADPIFSTGTYLAMRGAEMLADAIVADGSGDATALGTYERRWLDELAAWQRIIDLWYDGRLFSLLRVGRFMRRLPPARPIDRHVARHMTRIFTGEAGQAGQPGQSGYGRHLLTTIAPMGRLGARALSIR